MLAPRPTRPVLFCGGGSAGHLVPGFAVQEALAELGVPSFFATPGEAVEDEWFDEGVDVARIAAARLPRRPLAAMRFLPKTATGMREALALIRRRGVGAVVALGGWPCVPAVLAARLARVPLAFLAVDRVPGLVVRRFAARATKTYLAHEEAAAALSTGAPTQTVGPLLRHANIHGRRDPERYGLRRDRATLLVLGGSLGAAGLFKAWLAGLEAAVVQDSSLRERIQVLHATGHHGVGVWERYRALGVQAHVAPFLHPMGDVYATADLALTRGGASTCAELAATRTPAVLVPYPHHTDRQQVLNAEPLVARGGAVLVEEAALTPERVAEEVLARLLDPQVRGDMAGSYDDGTLAGAGAVAADLVRCMGEGRRGRALPRLSEPRPTLIAP